MSKYIASTCFQVTPEELYKKDQKIEPFLYNLEGSSEEIIKKMALNVAITLASIERSEDVAARAYELIKSITK